MNLRHALNQYILQFPTLYVQGNRESLHVGYNCTTITKGNGVHADLILQ